MTKTKAKLAGNKTRSAAHKRQASKPKTPRKTKATLMREMLEVEGGASLDDLCNATGWQPHTVRGAIAGTLKNKLGLAVVSAKVEGRGRVYSLPPA